MKGQDDLEVDTTWFHIFTDMAKNGDLIKIEGSAIKVYIAIKSHVNFTKGTAFPSEQEIGKLTGLSERQVRRCLASLQEHEYININKQGRSNIYTLREKVCIKDKDGVAQAVATWDYIPNGVKDAVAELKKVVTSGKMLDGKIIHIEHLTLNIFQHESMQINTADTVIDKERVKENIKKLKDTLKKKSH